MHVRENNEEIKKINHILGSKYSGSISKVFIFVKKHMRSFNSLLMHGQASRARNHGFVIISKI